MNRIFFTVILILVCLSSIAGQCYAWPLSPEIYISNWYMWTPLRYFLDDEEATETFYAYCISGGPIGPGDWDWNWPSEAEDVTWVSYADDHSELTFRFSTTGRYEFEVEAYNEYGLSDWDWAVIYVIEVSLSPESDYIPLSEDNLVEVDISLLPSTLSFGTVTLEKETSGSGNIKVYYDSGGQNEVSLPVEWSVARQQVPQSVWVEGIAASSEPNDVALRISYKHSTSTKDEETAEFTILDVQITEPNGDPFYDNEFVFVSGEDPSHDPAICNVNATGTTGISALNADLEWTLTEMEDDYCELTWTGYPDPATGSTVTFTYTGDCWPEHNSSFGEKTLTLEHESSGFTDMLIVEIFFPKNVEVYDPGHGYDTPNWFYYWKEGNVVSDMSDFIYSTDTTYAGFYDFTTDTLYLCDNAAKSGYADEVFINHYYRTSVNTGEDGICDTSVVDEDPYKQDEQVIPVGWGEPDAVAITDGGDGLQTTKGGDDEIVGSTITTGDNGICETTPVAGGNDEYVWYGDIQMELGHGKPYTICITSGEDDFLHSADENLVSEDELDFSDALEVTYQIDYTGIYYVAVVCTHELKHQSLLVPLGAPCTWSELEKTSDNDCVDNNLEGIGPYYLDPDRKDTYNLGADFLSSYPIEWQSDNEFLAYLAGQSPGSVDPDEDWSDTDGAQWKQ